MRRNTTRIAGRPYLVIILLFMAGCSGSHEHSQDHFFHIDAQKRIVIAVPGRPDAVIDRRHRLFIGDQRIELDADQNADISRYYKGARRMHDRGIDVGKAGAHFGLRVIKDVFSGLSSGDADTIEPTVQADKQHFLGRLAPLCHAVAQTYAAQQSLVRDLPRFAPYAAIHDPDVQNCRAQVAEHEPTHA